MSEKLLRCFECMGTFKKEEMKHEKVPSNFHAQGTKSAETGEVDQCPHCDAVAFFGFREAS